jgi:putative ABC transport system substrate-binding protein
MKRRETITLLGGVAAWPLAARGQQPLPLVEYLHPGSPEVGARDVAAFRKGLGETGYIEGQNVTVGYHWLEGRYDHVPALMADLVRRPVDVIAIPSSGPAARVAKSATSTIPIVFGVAGDPVRMGLVASLARPGGNATGVNFLAEEVASKRLRLLHDLAPKVARVVVLVNPANVNATENTLRDLHEAAPTMGLELRVLKATTIAEIDAAFATFAQEHPDALFVGPDGFFSSRRVQFAILAARERIPATYTNRGYVTAGGLMSYGTDLVDVARQVGTYTGRILKGAKPADLPVQQSTKFEFIINLQTARALGLEMPPAILSIADELIE